MRKIKLKYLIYIISLLGAIVFHFYLKEDREKTKIQEEIEYPFISKNRIEYKGVILERSKSRIWKNTYLFELSNKQKFAISGFSFLQVGDSLYKPENIDTLYLFTEDGKQDSISIKYNLYNLLK